MQVEVEINDPEEILIRAILVHVETVMIVTIVTITTEGIRTAAATTGQEIVSDLGTGTTTAAEMTIIEEIGIVTETGIFQPTVRAANNRMLIRAIPISRHLPWVVTSRASFRHRSRCHP